MKLSPQNMCHVTDNSPPLASSKQAGLRFFRLRGPARRDRTQVGVLFPGGALMPELRERNKKIQRLWPFVEKVCSGGVTPYSYCLLATWRTGPFGRANADAAHAPSPRRDSDFLDRLGTEYRLPFPPQGARPGSASTGCERKEDDPQAHRYLLARPGLPGHHAALVLVSTIIHMRCHVVNPCRPSPALEIGNTRKTGLLASEARRIARGVLGFFVASF
jgi:hypothetical protein